MEGMALPKCFMLVILGKHPSSIYRELNRNGSGGVYTGNEAQAASAQRRLESKPSPKLDDRALTREIMGLFKLIRQYLPKKTPFDTLTQKQLDKIVDRINNRPRKVLGYLTPYEVFSP
jgi:IS30 family transposase